MGQPIRKKIQEEHANLIKEEPILTLIIDGSSLLFSSFADDKINPDGVHYGAVYQFLLQMKMQLSKRVFDKVFVTFDNEYSGYKRWELYKPYKANRDKTYAEYGLSDYMKQYNETLKNMQQYLFNKGKKSSPKHEKSDAEKFIDENFDRERDILCEIFNEMFIRWSMDEIVEGDDMIAYYCLHKKSNEKILLISSDMDLCQLLSDDVMIYNQRLKKYISNINFKQYFDYDYENILLKKILCGDVSDNIGNIKGLSEDGLYKLMPEIKDRRVELDEVKKKCQNLIEQRKNEKKRPLLLHENILNGVSNKEYDGDFYEINEKIINLKKPLMTESCIEEMDGIINSPLDPEGRSIKNVVKIVYDNQMVELIGDTKFASFFSTFKKIEDKEREFYEKNAK